MPCRDWDVPHSGSTVVDKGAAVAKAGLCAVLTVLESDDAAFADMLKKINWKEAGITKREMLLWWESHKEQDARRRERMAEQLREIKIRKDALAKLTPEEKKVLGIK